MPWETLAGQVRVLATRLRAMGVRPGDRVVSCMPNIPHTVIAMLATTTIGAIWASCSPDFGWRGVIDRFTQLAPKVLFCVDGYRYGGKEFDRTAEMRQIIDGLASLEHVIYLPYLRPQQAKPPHSRVCAHDCRAPLPRCGPCGRPAGRHQLIRIPDLTRRLAARRLREADLNAEPAAGQRVRLQPRAMRLGDRSDDREPEAEPFVAAGAAAAVALEWLEEPADLIRLDQGPVLDTDRTA